MYAAQLGNVEIVKLLLDTGKSHPEYQDRYCRSALIYAAQLGNVEIVKLLLDTGKSHPEYQDYKKMTAIMLAAKNGYMNIVELLKKFYQPFISYILDQFKIPSDIENEIMHHLIY
jgi:ankyrin repeat protein